ncbi:hypothetical protein NQZ71_10450 [Niallia taxi]|uniref:hypothetical protein n=1 Tax=Niallia taxi TaxID=2499688 RepID=UPI0023A93ECE|nr:hypothetical protein [Niallia taxi]MDE5053399.1 hypothetical protein [Niallia taxi]WOD61254.1 hypothetical protein NQZ71_10450 [Niallia taxi]
MKTKAKIKGVKYKPEYTHPRYKVKLETPAGKELIIEFDYSNTTGKKGYKPLGVQHDGEDMGVKLSWYSRQVEGMTVSEFLGILAFKVDKKYKVIS